MAGVLKKERGDFFKIYIFVRHFKSNVRVYYYKLVFETSLYKCCLIHREWLLSFAIYTQLRKSQRGSCVTDKHPSATPQGCRPHADSCLPFFFFASSDYQCCCTLATLFQQHLAAPSPINTYFIKFQCWKPIQQNKKIPEAYARENATSWQKTIFESLFRFSKEYLSFYSSIYKRLPKSNITVPYQQPKG